MKNTAKRIMTLLTAGALALGMSGCGQTPAPVPENPDSQPGSDKKIVVGVIQPIEHDALGASFEGFKKALADNGFVDGQNIEFDYQNAQGDMSNLSTIADRFVSREVDIVLAIATDAAQTVAAKTTEIPVIGTAITSFTQAGLVESDAAPGRNITGSSDMNPVEAQIALAKELVPELKTIGFIYNSSEDNSKLQIDIAKEKAKALGLEFVEVTVTNGSDVMQAMQSLVTKCQAIYIPTDNVVANAMASVSAVAAEAGIPTICGEANMVKEGGLVSMGINYFDLGYTAGLMAVDVIGGADPATMPVRFAEKSDEVTFNVTVAEEIGFVIPEKFADASMVE